MPGAEGTDVGTSQHRLAPSTVDAVQPRNFLQACLLLFLREGDAHGYALLERLEELGRHSDRGVVYRTLRLLEREELVASAWENSAAGPSRRSYSLTAQGEAVLSAWVYALEEGARLLEDYLERYQRITESPAAAGPPPMPDDVG